MSSNPFEVLAQCFCPPEQVFRQAYDGLIYIHKDGGYLFLSHP
jgi:hypothetical protein